MLADIFLIVTSGAYLAVYRESGERRDLFLGGLCLCVGLAALWRDVVRI